MNKRQQLFTILLAVLFSAMTGLLIHFSLELSQNNKRLNDRIDQLQLLKGEDGRTPTNEEILALINPLVRPGQNGSPGANGVNGSNGVDGNDGSDGLNGSDAQPCTTYTDENNDNYLACPDGTQTLLPQPDQPRQIELCATATIPLGWRYVGSTLCQKVIGS